MHNSVETLKKKVKENDVLIKACDDPREKVNC